MDTCSELPSLRNTCTIGATLQVNLQVTSELLRIRGVSGSKCRDSDKKLKEYLQYCLPGAGKYTQTASFRAFSCNLVEHSSHFVHLNRRLERICMIIIDVLPCTIFMIKSVYMMLSTSPIHSLRNDYIRKTCS